MEVWLIVVISVVAVCFLCCCLPCMCCSCSNSMWARKKKAQVDSLAKICETKYGPVEYSIAEPDGEKPCYVLVCNGTPGFHAGDGVYNCLFKNQGFGEIVPSRPNFGRTKLNGDWKTLAHQADGFIALMDELKIETFAVYGISGGGPLACTLAIKYPDRIKSLILDSAITGGLKVEGTDEV